MDTICKSCVWIDWEKIVDFHLDRFQVSLMYITYNEYELYLKLNRIGNKIYVYVFNNFYIYVWNTKNLIFY